MADFPVQMTMGSSVSRLADLQHEANEDYTTASVDAMQAVADNSANPTTLAGPESTQHDIDPGYNGTHDQFENIVHHDDNHQDDHSHFDERKHQPTAFSSSSSADLRRKDDLNISTCCPTLDADVKRAGSAPPAVSLESKDTKLPIERLNIARPNPPPSLIAKGNTCAPTPQPDSSTPKKAAEDPAPATAIEEDSDEPTILSVKQVAPELKRKASSTSNSGLANKRRRQTKSTETEDEEATPVPKRKLSITSSSASTKEPSKQSKTAGTETEPSKPCPKRTAADKTATITQKKRSNPVETPDETISGSEEDEDEDVSESEEDEDQNLQVAKDLAKANKDFGKACRTCKTNANKVLKAKHDAEVSQLKKQKRDELRQAKGKADQDLKAAKLKAERMKSALQQKHECQIEELKSHCDTKIKKLKEGHKEAFHDSEEKYDEMKDKLEAKIRKLTKERGDAETKRKEIEKTLTKELKDMTSDQKAAELRLKEERKQIVRDCLQQVNELKPEHSSALKAKQKNIEEMAQKVIRLEAQLQQSDTYLRELSTDGQAEKVRLEKSQAEAEKWREQIAVVEDNLREFEAYVTQVEGRSKSNIARAQADCDQQIGIARVNLQEANNRLVEQQRRNKNLNETLMVQTQLGREKDARIQALESQLSMTQAEIGLAAEMENFPDPQTPEAHSSNIS